jgi:luciferase family oxidoreductase group 1
MELQSYFAPAEPKQPLRAIPGAGLEIPLYLLGSSDFSARLAANLGLPFAFASHFAPDLLYEALELYRRNFQPSVQLAKPHVIVAVNVFAADTEAEAGRLFTSLQQAFLGIIRGARSELPPPLDSMDGVWSPSEANYVQRMLRCSAVGSLNSVRDQLGAIIQATGSDEIIATAQIHDHQARLHSFELAAKAFEKLG